ncbi:CobW family GTP-binding protein [Candidatus Formimonas warabiya]|uniref:Cobalamin biosynthesis protein CobW n=1 Tax=Formimonas warabiya TaxID=1761012 RepID=A0A3G1KYH9_FORW1|nr:GTP-binding protein [Candidatus Formimonas warabiya]ATW27544.1 cobalamin biosynthesis protein CobW [Candidatus Formimonas warabiya]
MGVKIDIISGFLGAGKTTLIKKLLEEELCREKPVIIENEFGEIGIDGTLLKKSGIEIKEINSGCICCSLVGEFERSIQEVLSRFKPSRIIIEPSGVGKLSEVIKACTSPRIKGLLVLNMVITVVDIQNYQLYLENFGEFFSNQIQHAKTLILSRTQDVSPEEVAAAVKSLHQWNDRAHIVTTPWAQLRAEQLIALAEGKDSLVPGPDPEYHGAHHAHAAHGDKAFEVWSKETPKIFPEKELRRMLEKMDQVSLVGRVLRAKGIVQAGPEQWVQFDFVPREVNIRPVEPDYSGRLCIIGQNLNRKGLANLFQVMD